MSLSTSTKVLHPMPGHMCKRLFLCDEGTSLSTPALVSFRLYGTDRKIVKDTSGSYGREGGHRQSHEILVD